MEKLYNKKKRPSILTIFTGLSIETTGAPTDTFNIAIRNTAPAVLTWYFTQCCHGKHKQIKTNNKNARCIKYIILLIFSLQWCQTEFLCKRHNTRSTISLNKMKIKPMAYSSFSRHFCKSLHNVFGKDL